jgi:molybdate transport system substrate-binding protein
MRVTSIRALIATTAIWACLLTDAAAADEIRLLASNAVRTAYQELLPAFEHATGHHVIVEWGGTLDIIERAAGQEPLDVVVVPNHRVDALIAQGAAVSRVDLAVSRIGAAGRRGVTRGDITTLESLKAAIVAAPSIVLSSGPSHTHMLALFRDLGIADAVRDKIVQLKPGLSVGKALMDGCGDLGFTQISELLPFEGIGYLGPLPPSAQSATIFSAGVLARARSPAAARGLISHLTQNIPVATLQKHGLDRPSSGQ